MYVRLRRSGVDAQNDAIFQGSIRFCAVGCGTDSGRRGGKGPDQKNLRQQEQNSKIHLKMREKVKHEKHPEAVHL